MKKIKGIANAVVWTWATVMSFTGLYKLGREVVWSVKDHYKK